MRYVFFLVVILVIFTVFVAFLARKSQVAKRPGVATFNGSSKINCHVSKFMLELYESGLNMSSIDVVRSVTPEKVSRTEDYKNVGHLLMFELPQADERETFIYAELKILTMVETTEKTGKVICEPLNVCTEFHVLGIKRKVALSVFDDVQKKFIDVHILHVHHSTDTWLSFDLTKQVSTILQKHDKTLEILITLTSKDFNLSLLPDEETFDHDYPVLLLSYISNEAKRKKRNIEEDYEEETNNIWDDLITRKINAKKLKKIKNSCRRKQLYIDFAEINYDEWIVQPKGYEAYQCQGKCYYPVADHLTPTKHAIMQTLLHSVAPSKASRSCCVPTSLDSISVLYVDTSGVLTYRYAYKDMVVVECGCR